MTDINPEDVERVARVLQNFNLDEMSPGYEQDIRRAARAAIAAMRPAGAEKMRERAAKWIESVGYDWNAAQDYYKRDAATYLADGVRALPLSGEGT